MDVLPLHFRTLRMFGVWYETKRHWLIKFLWQPFTINSMIFFTLSQLSALLVYRDNVSDFTECLFLSLTYFGLCFKLLNFLSRRDAMLELLNEFRNDICSPRNDREIELLKSHERVNAILFYVHIGVAQFNGIALGITPLLIMMTTGIKVLPYKTYEIYDKANMLYYCVTYVFQVVADAIGIFVNVTLDTMLAGFLLLTCGQIDLCCYRFITSSNDRINRSTVEFVKHQLLIRSIVRKLSIFFMRVVLPLMFLSLITFCTSIYNISQSSTTGAESLTFFLYLICLLCQLCCYCWFGNELKLKSAGISDTIYNSNWTALIPSDRKNLYFIMLSCQKELSISFHGFCALTIEIFVWVLKTSYTAYNLLKTIESNDSP